MVKMNADVAVHATTGNKLLRQPLDQVMFHKN